MISIIKAEVNHIPLIAPLFNQYRIFYAQDSDLDAAKRFLEERFSKNESAVFVAFNEDQKAVGFTQLYTTFSSVSLQPIFILNDLFVIKTERGNRIGEALLNKAKEFCQKMNYKGLALETASDNPAQHLYEKLGWKKDSGYFHYFWTSQ